MRYKVGDIVWYLDKSVVPIPKVKSGKVVNVLPDEEIYKVDFLTWDYTTEEYLLPTKEALLAAIDPPAHSFVVGQTVWYLDRQIPQDVVCIYKDIIESVECNGNWLLLKSRSFYAVHLDDTFATPDEAFAKAKEVQGW